MDQTVVPTERVGLVILQSEYVTAGWRAFGKHTKDNQEDTKAISGLKYKVQNF